MGRYSLPFQLLFLSFEWGLCGDHDVGNGVRSRGGCSRCPPGPPLRLTLPPSRPVLPLPPSLPPSRPLAVPRPLSRSCSLAATRSGTATGTALPPYPSSSFAWVRWLLLQACLRAGVLGCQRLSQYQQQAALVGVIGLLLLLPLCL